EVYEPITAGREVVVSRREGELILCFLGADDTNDARIGSIVPPSENGSPGITEVEVAVLGLKLFPAVAVAVGIVDCVTLLECWLFSVVNVARVTDVAPHRQIVPIV